MKAQSAHDAHMLPVRPVKAISGVLFMSDSDVPVVAAASRLPQGSLQPPGAAGDRAQLIRHPLVSHRLRLALPPRLRGQSLW